MQLKKLYRLRFLSHTKRLILVALVMLTLGPHVDSFSQQTKNWHGFEKTYFSFEGRKAYIVNPESALQGNPWIWRAYFPDWHYEMDSILVARGFHIAFIDCSDMFGSPEAMQVWEKFYQHLTITYSFSKKPVLEGVSRGGLYIYGWAKRNPDKVSFIYAEAPVLDIKSWPGGKGNGKGSPDDWHKCLAAYGFSEQQAITFSDNPVNNIESLAAYKVPAIHVVCMSDSVVPVAENTTILAKEFQKWGGTLRIDKINDNVRLEGHHFDITHPHHYADLILKSVMPVKQELSSSAFIMLNGKLDNTFRKIRNNKELTVAFLGGSITYNPGWRDKVCKYLCENYPQTNFNFIEAGIPSLGSLPHSFRLQTDVLDKGNIDLLFVETAVNDRANSTDTATQLRAMEGIIRHAFTANPAMNIVLMAFADEEKNRDFEKGIEPFEVKVHRQLAEYYSLPFINLAREIYDRINHDEFSWKDDFKDLHPSPFGQNIYYQSIKTLFQLAEKETRDDVKVVVLPEPMNTGAYENGSYIGIHLANRLKGFTIAEDWVPSDKKETRPGFVHVPVLEAVKPGSSFTFSFTGNAIGIAILSGPDSGIIEYQIDGGKPKTLNLSTQWSNYLHLPWYLMLADNLKKGSHILELKTLASTEPKGGSACRVVHFLVNQ